MAVMNGATTSTHGSEGERADQPVVVVGAGLAGLLSSLYMRRRGMDIVISDIRDDPRIAQLQHVESAQGKHKLDGLGKLGNATRRSINLALSARGLRALRKAGLDEDVLQDAVQMNGRMIHDLQGRTTLQPYGDTPDEALYSVSRDAMTRYLVDNLTAPPAEGEGRVDVRFRSKCVGISAHGTVQLQTADGRTEAQPSQVVIGADGIFSVTRREISRHTRLNLFQEYIEHGYIEVGIPPSPEGEFQLEPSALHIWPRHDFMLIALPNVDRSFTGTLFASWDILAKLENQDYAVQWFTEQFPDAACLVPSLGRALSTNVRGALATVKCSPWHANGRILLIGDAAHSVVPFYGQGMNCCFEDCLVLDEAYELARGDWSIALPLFYNARKSACDALAELSLHNYVEMCALAGAGGARAGRPRGRADLCAPRPRRPRAPAAPPTIPPRPAGARAPRRAGLCLRDTSTARCTAPSPRGTRRCTRPCAPRTWSTTRRWRPALGRTASSCRAWSPSPGSRPAPRCSPSRACARGERSPRPPLAPWAWTERPCVSRGPCSPARAALKSEPGARAASNRGAGLRDIRSAGMATHALGRAMRARS